MAAVKQKYDFDANGMVKRGHTEAEEGRAQLRAALERTFGPEWRAVVARARVGRCP
ncbi:hypothetical protein ACFL6C_08850 [Myxococcota bacterium]